jgi:hypothetical protein
MLRLSSGLWNRSGLRMATAISENSAASIFTPCKWVSRIHSKRRYLPLWLHQSHPKCHSKDIYCCDNIIKIISNLTNLLLLPLSVEFFVAKGLTLWQNVQDADWLVVFMNTITNFQVPQNPETSWPAECIRNLRKNIHVEVFAVLGCYAAYVGSCFPAFRGSLSVTSSRTK